MSAKDARKRASATRSGAASAVALERLRGDVGERLARVESALETCVSRQGEVLDALREHTQADERHFDKLATATGGLDAKITALATAQAVAEASGRSAGKAAGQDAARSTSLRWSAAIAGGIVGLAQVAKAFGWIG